MKFLNYIFNPQKSRDFFYVKFCLNKHRLSHIRIYTDPNTLETKNNWGKFHEVLCVHFSNS